MTHGVRVNEILQLSESYEAKKCISIEGMWHLNAYYTMMYGVIASK